MGLVYFQFDATNLGQQCQAIKKLTFLFKKNKKNKNLMKTCNFLCEKKYRNTCRGVYFVPSMLCKLPLAADGFACLPHVIQRTPFLMQPSQLSSLGMGVGVATLWFSDLNRWSFACKTNVSFTTPRSSSYGPCEVHITKSKQTLPHPVLGKLASCTFFTGTLTLLTTQQQKNKLK